MQMISGVGCCLLYCCVGKRLVVGDRGTNAAFCVRPRWSSSQYMALHRRLFAQLGENTENIEGANTRENMQVGSNPGTVNGWMCGTKPSSHFRTNLAEIGIVSVFLNMNVPRGTDPGGEIESTQQGSGMEEVWRWQVCGSCSCL